MDNASPNVSKARVAMTVMATQELAKSEALNHLTRGIENVFVSSDCG
jgi:hypothetical protein